MTRLLTLTFVVLLPVATAGSPAAAIRQGEQDRSKQEQSEDVTKGSKNIDEIVQHPMDAMHRALKSGMETYGFEIKKERPDYIEGTRSRKIGVFVGSGGEKVTIKLSAEKNGTRVKVETGKGFVGRLGKANWSTPIFKEAMRILADRAA
jgi:hypothetical protein